MWSQKVAMGKNRFMDEHELSRLDFETGEQLVKYARGVIASHLSDKPLPSRPTEDPKLDEDRGAFVTLKQDGDLRGCIGRPRAEQSLIEAIREAAIGAATNDPRFPPLAADELPEVTVSVSALTPPTELSPVDPEAVVIGRDGLIIQRGNRSGLLLPQVAVDRDWDGRTFLSETARKAGLPSEAWRDEATTVKRFSAQVFAESSPNGEITLDDFTRGGNSNGGEPTD